VLQTCSPVAITTHWNLLYATGRSKWLGRSLGWIVLMYLSWSADGWPVVVNFTAWYNTWKLSLFSGLISCPSHQWHISPLLSNNILLFTATKQYSWCDHLDALREQACGLQAHSLPSGYVLQDCPEHGKAMCQTNDILPHCKLCWICETSLWSLTTLPWGRFPTPVPPTPFIPPPHSLHLLSPLHWVRRVSWRAAGIELRWL